MKKGNVLIAVFAVIMAAASIAKAEGIKVNFDNAVTGNDASALMDAVAESNSVDTIPLPTMETKLTPPEPCGEVSIQPWPMPCGGGSGQDVVPQHNSDLGCAMVCVGGQLADGCQCLPDNPWMNGSSDGCINVAVEAGFTIPICPVAASGSNISATIMREVGNRIKETLPEYSQQNPGFDAKMAAIVKDKSVRILYNGERLFLRKTSGLKLVTDDSLGSHADYYDNHPETHGQIEVAMPQHTMEGAAAGGATGGMPGALIGAVIGLYQDVEDYVTQK